jgi:hypothetical protein
MRGWIKASDEDELRLLLQAPKVFSALLEILEYLRAQKKWGDPPDDIEKIYEWCCGICSEHAIDPWED